MALTPAQVEQYNRDGYLTPIRVMSAAEARRFRDRMEASEARAGGPLQGNFRHKTHLLYTWADELVHHPAVLDAVESVLGPDLLCWNTNLFAKEAASAGFISWHQDSTYWGLDPSDVITAWVAMIVSTAAPGTTAPCWPAASTAAPATISSTAVPATMNCKGARVATA